MMQGFGAILALLALVLAAIVALKTPEQDAAATGTAIAAAAFTKTPTRTWTPTPTATWTPSGIPTLPPTATPFPPVAKNSHWKPVERDFDGVTMVQVPAGCFMMGSNDGEGDEKPVTRICFEAPFWLDKMEVTQAQFKRLGGQAANNPYFTGDNRPVEQITWFEARDFCARRVARLPTEAEWEYAARGPDNLVYPWGNSFDGEKLVYNRRGSQGSAEVASIVGGASWVGALDLSGNVWEWVSSLYRPLPVQDDGREDGTNASDARVVRGGSWNVVITDYLRVAYRGWYDPDYWFLNLGFRCVHSS
jgi:formylglycine-generating enzyme required for sulfatase activity